MKQYQHKKKDRISQNKKNISQNRFQHKMKLLI